MNAKWYETDRGYAVGGQRRGGVVRWMIDLSWMAWTWPTAVFFICVALALVGMAVWEKLSPGGAPRRGILGLDTTRGDRLFISILGGAILHLAWLGLFGPPLLLPLGISIGFAIFVFRRV